MHFINEMGQYFQSLGVWGLCLNSFIESFFLVPPPDFLLIILDLDNPDRAMYYAFLCTIASALGGAFGYFIGRWGGRPVFDWIFSGLQKKEIQKQKNILIKSKNSITNTALGRFFSLRLPRYHTKFSRLQAEF